MNDENKKTPYLDEAPGAVMDATPFTDAILETSDTLEGKLADMTDLCRNLEREIQVIANIAQRQANAISNAYHVMLGNTPEKYRVPSLSDAARRFLKRGESGETLESIERCAREALGFQHNDQALAQPERNHTPTP